MNPKPAILATSELESTRPNTTKIESAKNGEAFSYSETPISLFQYRYTLAALFSSLLPGLLWLDWSTSLIALSIVAVRFFSVRDRPAVWPIIVRALLVIAMAAVVWIQYKGIIGRAGGGALLLGMLALKATETHNRRHARVLVIVSLFALIASFLINQSAFGLLLTIVAFIACFAALEVLSRAPLGPQHSPFSAIDGVNLSAYLLAVPVAILLWMFVPRLSSPMWGTEQAESGKLGLSDSMKIGTMSELLSDDTPAMRVRFDGGVRPELYQLYFRGPVLWNLDETGNWTTSWSFQNQRLEESTWTLDAKVPRLKYSVALEPSDMRYIFAADLAVSVDLPRTGRNIDGAFRRRQANADVIGYRAESALVEWMPMGPYPSLQRKTALKLPDNDPKTRALAQSWVQKNADPLALVEAALNHFRDNNFRYNLAAPIIESNSRSDAFLFETQEGYCEHFAHSFAVLMRAAGVPTRVATGFAGGYYPNGADYLLVSNANAHAWNEVLIGDRWWRVDPTSVIPQERVVGRGLNEVPELSLIQEFSDLGDRMSEWWNRTVLGFNAARQSQLLKPFGIDNADWRTLLLWLVGSVFGCVLIWIAWSYWHDRMPPADPLKRAYSKLRDSLRRHGFALPVEQAPNQLFKVLQQHQPQEATKWQALAQRFEQLEYGQDARQSVDPEQQAVRLELARELREVAKTWKQAASS